VIRDTTNRAFDALHDATQGNGFVFQSGNG
jgi:hypothetical protein